MTTSTKGRWAQSGTLPDRSLHLTKSRELEAIVAGRSQAARGTALVAARAATARLQDSRRERKAIGALALLAGLIGLAGLAAICALDLDYRTRLVLGCLTALADFMPFAHCLYRITEDANEEEHAAVAAEVSRNIAFQAECLDAAANAASDHAGLSPTASYLLNHLLDNLEQAANAAKGREKRTRKQTVERGRRHVRIKPNCCRVGVTTTDNRRLNANIIDVSASGVALQGNMPGLQIGSIVVIGSRKARAVRRLSNGWGFEFAQGIPVGLLDADIIL